MFNQVINLATGYSRSDALDSNTTIANCTSTLVKSYYGKNIVVDTMTAWDGEIMINALKENSLEPKDINYVVCTHGHSDHTGCNYLFSDAEWHFMGTCLSQRDRYFGHNWEYPFELINKEVQIIHTPGHTLSCVSVLVNNTQSGKTIGICGDLFENEQDVWNSKIWLNAGSENPKIQRENRAKLANVCSYIIPGHGKEFAVTDDIRNKLQQDLNETYTK